MKPNAQPRKPENKHLPENLNQPKSIANGLEPSVDVGGDVVGVVGALMAETYWW
jgi:hypothetical protein